MIEGGADTTSSALLTVMLAAVLHPEAVKKAQIEIDTLLADGRAPTLEDIVELPYCQAL